MQRILYIDSSQGIFGGGQISLLELLANIDRAKFQPLVIIGEEGRLKDEIDKLGVECKVFSMSSLRRINPFPAFACFWRIFKYVRRKNIALIHGNTSRAALYAGPTAKFLGIPLIWHVRIPHQDKLLDRILVWFSSRIIVVSKAVKRRFDRFKKANVEIIYNGVDTKKFSPGPTQDDVREKIHIDSQDIVIGTLGRISPEKGLEDLILAMRDVVKVYSRTKILIAGNGGGKYSRYLREKVDEAGVSSHVVFAGFREDASRILKCMDIFCLPSLSEGFNRSLLEAMACGLPVIATSVGGNVEIVQNGANGLLVLPADHGALTDAISELLNDKEGARRMGLEGRRFVEDNFSIEKSTRQIEDLYERIFNGKIL